MAFDEPRKPCGRLTEADYASWRYVPGSDIVVLSDIWRGGDRDAHAVTLPLADIDEFVSAGDAGRIVAALEAACARGSDGDVCLRYRTDEPGGRQRVIDVRGHARRGADGEATEVVGVRVDVTAFAAARAEASRAAALVSKARDLFAVSDAQGRLLQLNDGGRRLLGLGADALEGRRLTDFTTPEGARYLNGPVREQVAAEGRAEGTLTLLHQETGEAIPCAHECYVVADPEGGAPVFAAILRDLRAERAAEARLHAQRERAAMALRCSGMGVGEIDVTTMACRVDERFCEILGLPHVSDPDAHVLLDALVPEDRDSLVARFAAIRGGDEPRAFTGRCRPGGAGYIEMDVEVIARNADGAPCRLIGLLRDVTEEVRAADALRHRAEALAAEKARAEALIDELNHRVRNNLALMQSIVAMSVRSEGTQGGQAGMVERIGALAIAHTISEGGTRPVHLRDVIRAVTEVRSPATIRVAGPPAVLTPDVVTPVVLLFNELMANAVQHGALADPASGEVSVQWSVEDGRLAIDWTERVPGRVLRAPATTGTGVMLMTAAAKQVGAAFDLDWTGEGLSARIVVQGGVSTQGA